MNVCGIEWVACLLVASALFFNLPNVSLRQGLLALCNAGFLVTLVPDAGAWIALAAFLGIGYLTVRVMLVNPRRIILIIYLAALIFAFVVLKQYAFLRLVLPATLFQRVVATVGLSYMLFRQIHVVVDAFQGQIENFSLWNYLNYQINLFGFIAGPIQRYQDFCQYWLRLEPIATDLEAILRAYLRVFLGVLKIAIVAAVCLAAYQHCAATLAGTHPSGIGARLKSTLTFLGMFYFYPAYIYFNFSGYCDMVIGGASLFGVKMPENFDRPFLSRNMIEYWTRWHRTLGFWIRDYVFTPMYKAIAGRWPHKAASLAFLCYFVALFLTGIWHGSTWNFVIFGLLNGIGVAAAKLWENHLIRRGGRQGLRNYLHSRVIRVGAVMANFHYVCLTILFFPSDLAGTFQLLKHAFI